MLRQPGLRQIVVRRVGAGGGENPLTFTSGLTRTADTVANDLITGKAGGQTVVGGTAAGDNLTLRSTSNATAGLVIVPGSVSLGTTADFSCANFPAGGSLTAPSISFGTAANHVGIVAGSNFLQLGVNGTAILQVQNNTLLGQGNFISAGVNSAAAPAFNVNNQSGVYFIPNGFGCSAAGVGVLGLTRTAAPFVFTAPAPVANNTASTEFVAFDCDMSRTSTWATGALPTQREVLFRAPTYAFAGVSTITTAATVAISGAPIAGANATITNPLALWVQAGAANIQNGGALATPAISFGAPANQVGIVAGSNFLQLDVNGVAVLQVQSNALIGQGNFVSAGTNSAASPAFNVNNASGVYFLPNGFGCSAAGVGVLGLTKTSTPFVFTAPPPGSNNTASTEFVAFDVNMSRTSTWSTGALATQREVLFRAPTYAFAGASTIASAATVAISGAPIAGANAAITSPLALWVQSGGTRLDGGTFTTFVQGQTSLDLLGADQGNGAINFELTKASIGLVDQTFASAAFVVLDLLRVGGPVITITGATPITNSTGFNLNRFDAPTIVSPVNIGAGGTTPAAATVVISGPPTITGGGLFVGNGAVGLWVQGAGTVSYFDGTVTIAGASGLSVTGTNGIQIVQGTTAITINTGIGLTMFRSGGDLPINFSSSTGNLLFQGNGIEAFRIFGGAPAGRIQFAAANLAANGTGTGLAFGSLAPAGAHTNPQEWLTVMGTGGAQRWIPMF